MVALVEIRVSDREVGDGMVEDVALAEVKRFTEPVALLSTQPTDLPLPRTALGRSFNLLALRARCVEETMGDG
jgi:hypothetical protein